MAVDCPLTYTIVVTNNGPTAADVLVTDTLPGNVVFMSASAGAPRRVAWLSAPSGTGVW